MNMDECAEMCVAIHARSAPAAVLGAQGSDIELGGRGNKSPGGS